MNVYEAVATPRAEGLSADMYTAFAFCPFLPEHVIRDAFKTRDVKINGKRVKGDAEVEAGALVQIYTGYHAEIPVVYEDDRILLVNKPAGAICCDNEYGGLSVLSIMTDRAKGDYAPRLCHRLDTQTTGLLLLCKDDESESILLDAFKNRTLEKIYQCLVRGEMRPKADTKTAYLIKDAEKAQVRIVTHQTPGALPIATQYETLDFDGTLSRLRVTLLTGRTHQIRAHMSFLSHPLLGDDKYGDRALNRRLKAGNLKLCATELTLHVGGALSYLDNRHFEIYPPF